MNLRLERLMEEKSGFTLIELLLVLAIIGMLTAVVVVNYSGKQQKAMIKTTRASIDATATAVRLYEVDTGRLPSSLQNLVSSSGEPNWDGPYLENGRLPIDPWGIAIQYAAKDAKSFEIRSAGPDKNMGTEDDITN